MLSKRCLWKSTSNALAVSTAGLCLKKRSTTRRLAKVFQSELFRMSDGECFYLHWNANASGTEKIGDASEPLIIVLGDKLTNNFVV